MSSAAGGLTGLASLIEMGRRAHRREPPRAARAGNGRAPRGGRRDAAGAMPQKDAAEAHGGGSGHGAACVTVSRRQGDHRVESRRPRRSGRRGRDGAGVPGAVVRHADSSSRRARDGCESSSGTRGRLIASRSTQVDRRTSRRHRPGARTTGAGRPGSRKDTQPESRRRACRVASAHSRLLVAPDRAESSPAARAGPCGEDAGCGRGRVFLERSVRPADSSSRRARDGMRDVERHARGRLTAPRSTQVDRCSSRRHRPEARVTGAGRPGSRKEYPTRICGVSPAASHRRRRAPPTAAPGRGAAERG
jgi:hypothetical protein